MRIAVIGSGTMGGRHAQILAALPGVSDVLVVDADRSRADAVARNIGGTPATHERALDLADAVVIATPAEHHAASVEAAVERGIPALCEKPLTEDLASSIRLVERVEERGAHVEVGFHRRHDPSYAEARARVASDRAGRVHLLRLTAYDPRIAPRPIDAWRAMDSAPLFLNSSIHDFDFVRWMTGQDVVEVHADGSRRDGERPADERGVETAVVTMRLSGGTLALLEATWLHPSGYDSRVELVADHEHLSMGLSPHAPVDHLDWRVGDAPPDPWTGFLDRFDAAYRAELVSFLSACRGESPPASSARDGLEAHRIAVAATRSYIEHRPIAVHEVPGAREREAV
jgi:myo-inositol 2-dehydrogenase / D-chiro-inositol 1-dehydrogenase